MGRGGVCPRPREGGVLAREFVKSCEKSRRKRGERSWGCAGGQGLRGLRSPLEAPVAGREPSVCVKEGTRSEVRSYLSQELKSADPQPFSCVVTRVAAFAPWP